jgi:hypothetical protein
VGVRQTVRQWGRLQGLDHCALWRMVPSGTTPPRRSQTHRNVTPDALGRIPSEQTQRLREIGAWMSVHGKTIIGTRGGPLLPILIPKTPDQVPANYAPEMLGGGGVRPHGSRCQAGCTSVDKRLYIHVWPGVADAVLELPPEVAKVAIFCRRLDGSSVPYRLEEGWLQVPVPPEPGPIATLVVELAVPAARLPLTAFKLRTAPPNSYSTLPEANPNTDISTQP